MALTPGSFVGSYEVTGLLGIGGMGEVYSARDSKLERRVAIKVLPQAFAEDAERRERFEREARLLASLNHPNIATLHGFEQDESSASGSFSALVMELVEGPTLADRVAAGPMPMDDALAIAKQIAAALEAAHEQGVVHRDLKPANIKLRADGGVKVLDFGLAKALASDTAAPLTNATLTSLTRSQPGFVLGTAAYMSPEQARGVSVDKSADLWAFGCVLYEMLTGTQAFAGEDTTDVIAAVVRSEPDWTKLPAGTPPLIQTLLRQCLRKQPRQRLADARSARLMIEEAIAAPVGSSSVRKPVRTRWALLAAVAAATAAVTGFTVWRLTAPPEAEHVVTRALLGVEPASHLTPAISGGRPARRMMTLSPDGRTLVFSGIPADGGAARLYTRSLDAVEAVPLTGVETGTVPFFSPDGAWLAFWSSDGELRRVPADGGPPELIARAVPGSASLTTPSGEHWGADGTIVFSYSGGGGIFRVRAESGTAERITTLDTEAGELRHVLPHVLPDGRTLLYTAVIDTNGTIDSVVVALRLDNGVRSVLLERAADARYVSSGHLLFMRNGTLMAAGFDPERVALTTPAVAVLADVAQSIGTGNSNDETYEGQFVVAPNGTLLYLTGGLYPLRRVAMVAVSRDGTATTLHAAAGDAVSPRMSPDGTRVAFMKRTVQRFGAFDVWIYDLERATDRPITFNGASVSPAWSPDGDQLVFFENLQRQLVRVTADGSTRTAVGAGGAQERTSAWSKALDSVAFVTVDDAGLRRIWIQPMQGGAPTLIKEGPFRFEEPTLSPDGKWLAYVSTEAGDTRQIWVQPVGASGAPVRISSEGGFGPIWSPDGRELFYSVFAPDRTTHMMAVDVDLTAGFSAGRPHELFADRFDQTAPMRNYDYDAVSQRFIMMKALEEGPAPVAQMRVVFNWLDELRRRVPVERR